MAMNTGTKIPDVWQGASSQSYMFDPQTYQTGQEVLGTNYVNGYGNPLSAASTYTDMSSAASPPMTNGQQNSPEYHTEYNMTNSYLPPIEHNMTPVNNTNGYPQQMQPLTDLGGSLQDVLGDATAVISTGLSGVSLEDGASGAMNNDPFLGHLLNHQMNGVMNGYVNGSMSSSSGSGSMGNNGLNGGHHNSEYPMAVSHGVSSETTHKINMIEEPMEFGYRFRYEVEGKAHGGLQGRSSNKTGSKRGTKIYPEIQIVNVPDSVDLVRLEARLVSATEDYYPHPNKCSGRNCNKKGVFRYEIKRQEHPDFRYVLNNLTILQIRKQDQKQSFVDQLTDINDDEFLMSGKRQTEQQTIKKAEELAKVKHNGVVRIRFQASFLDPQENKWKVAVNHSQPVHDQKQSNAAELRICRVSTINSPCNGGVEVYLLCEKVSKDDIKVKFRDSKGWEEDGTFQGTDVHYQFGIVFRVPAYKDLDIQKEVKVDMQLYRPSTSTYSKPIAFTYYPVASEQDNVTRKRRRIDPPHGMGGFPPYGPSGPYGGGGGGSYGSPGSDGGGGYNLPPSQGYADPTYGYSRPLAAHKKGTSSAPKDNKSGDSKGDQPMDLTVSSAQDQVPSVVEDVEGDSAPTVTKSEDSTVKTEPESPKSDKTSTPASPAEKTEAETEVKDEGDNDLETDGVCVEPSQKVIADVMSTKVKGPLIDTRAKPTPAARQTKTSHNMTGNNVEKLQKELDAITEQLTKERETTMSLRKHLMNSNSLIVDCLMSYAQTGDHLYFLSQFRYHLSFCDENGDNSIHMAVIHEQIQALRSMLEICKATNTMNAVHQLNSERQTPLHIATVMSNPDMVDALLCSNSNPLATNLNGDNCFHVAAQQGDGHTLHHLCRWMRQTNTKSSELDKSNHAGFTPLHKAVQTGKLECASSLIRAGADVNKGDGTSGQTALHHAILQDNVVLVMELLMNGKADVDAQAYNGNTALHMAVSMNEPNQSIIRMLIKSGADPEMENNEYEDDDCVGNSVYDLCDDNEHTLETIHASLEVKTENTASPISVDSIKNLTRHMRESLARDLDEMGDWKRLAKALDYSSLVPHLEQQSSPTQSLIKYLETDKSATISKLEKKLQEIGREDCVTSRADRNQRSQETLTNLRSVVNQPPPINKGAYAVSIDSGFGQSGNLSRNLS